MQTIGQTAFDPDTHGVVVNNNGMGAALGSLAPLFMQGGAMQQRQIANAQLAREVAAQQGLGHMIAAGMYNPAEYGAFVANGGNPDTANSALRTGYAMSGGVDDPHLAALLNASGHFAGSALSQQRAEAATSALADQNAQTAQRKAILDAQLTPADGVNAAGVRVPYNKAWAAGQPGAPQGVMPAPTKENVEGVIAQSKILPQAPDAEQNAGLSPDQARLMGVEPAADKMMNYVMPDGRGGITMDGRTDANTNQPIPPGSMLRNNAGPGQSINIDTKGQGAAEEKLYEAAARPFISLMEGGETARAKLNTLHEMQGALARIQAAGGTTGGLGADEILNLQNTINAGAHALGIDTPFNVADKDIMRKFNLELSGREMRDTAGARGSTAMLRTFIQANPGLSTSPTANARLLGIKEQQTQRAADLADALSEAVSRGAKIPDLQKIVQSYDDMHPIRDPITRQDLSKNPAIAELQTHAAQPGPAAAAAPAAAGPVAPSAAAIDALKRNPARRAEFDAKFGPGAASKALGRFGPTLDAADKQ